MFTVREEKKFFARRDSAVVLCVGIALLVPLWTVTYPAILDFPNHLTRVAIARHAADPVLGFGSYYRFSWHVTYLFFDCITYALSFIFGVFTAGKLALSVYVFLMAASTRYLLRSIGAPLFPFVLWPALMTYNWWFWVGSVNLLAGFCIGMFALGLTWKNRRAMAGSRFWGALALLVVLSAACHPFSALLTCSMVFPVLLSSVAMRPLRLSLIGAFVIALAVFELLLHVMYRQPWEPLNNLGRISWMLHGFYSPAVEARGMKIALFAAFCMWCLLQKDALRSYFLPFVLLMLIIMTPHSIYISGDNDMRCAMFLFFLVPFMVPSPESKLLRAIVTLVIVGCAVFWNYPHLKRQVAAQGIYREMETIAAGLPAAPRVRPVLNFTGRVEDQVSIYITFFRGGFYPFMFESPLHGLKYLKRPDCLGTETFDQVTQSCAGFYDYLVVPTFEPGDPHIAVQDLSSMGFAKKFSGKYYNCFAKQ